MGTGSWVGAWGVVGGLISSGGLWAFLFSAVGSEFGGRGGEEEKGV